MDSHIFQRATNNMRILIAAMVEKAKSGHPGGSMSGTDFIQTLYAEFLNWDPDDMTWPNRDRFFLDPGHMSPMLYAMLTLTGVFKPEDLTTFRQWGGILTGHPEVNPSHGIENTSGPLGQGHVMGVGAAIAEKFLRQRFGDWMEHYTYAFISDGGIQEEISQGAGRIAGHLKLGNFIMFFDANNVQLSTKVHEVTTENTAKKYEAWGWHVQTIDGNNVQEIAQALRNAKAEKERPSLIIGRTIMAKGSIGPNGENMEGLVSTHGQPLSKAGIDIVKTITALGGDPENPFTIFDDVKETWNNILDKKRQYAQKRKEDQKIWEKAHPELAEKYIRFTKKILPEIDFENILQSDNAPTRNASANVLSVLAEKVENMIVSSADLANSDKTDGFLKYTKPLAANDFFGQFLQAGVAEFTMSAIMNGILLHGGMYAACGTFFVFSDYQKAAIRMSALQQLPVIYIWSHDSYRVGEDGPTHQPVEQIASVSLLEQIKNHSGNPSMLILRPVDGAETNIAYKMAFENRTSPTGIILSRQNVKALPAMEGSTRINDAKEAVKGGYVVFENGKNPDIILLGNGSEVRTLYDAALLLKENDDIKCRIVSMISIGRFDQQPESYRKNIIPDNLPVFALTAGLPSIFDKYVGNRGISYGLEHFGYSAPAEVLDEKFGFTPDNIYKTILKLLGK
ncbi:MAG: transketolase [Bacteroidales bacterium]|nr:transketolase [Bacteroidales bacterium]